MRSTFRLLTCLGLLATSLSAQLVLVFPAAGQVLVRGKVVDDEGGKPIASASIELIRGRNPEFATTSDSAGVFQFSVQPGGMGQIRVTRIGYQQVTTRSFELIAGDTLTTEIALGASAVQVEPVIVSAALENGVLAERLSGFHKRKQLGAGYFFNEQKLQAAGGIALSDMLRGVPGITVSTDRRTPYGPIIMTLANRTQAQLSPFRRRGRTPNSESQIGPCPMQLYIDGRRFRTQDGGVDVISTADLVGVEVLRSLAEVPAEFSGVHARCGVISVWTRREPNR